MENTEKSTDVKNRDDNKEMKPQTNDVKPQQIMKFSKELKELAFVEKQFNCDVIQEMKELWEIISKSAHENRFENSNVMRVPELGDTILFYQQRAVEGKPFIWRSEIVNYPPKCNHGLRKAIITGIAIIDAKKTGMGGEATILDGGIGANYVEIKLTSQWFRGYSFTIIIIGRYTDEEELAKNYNYSNEQ